MKKKRIKNCPTKKKPTILLPESICYKNRYLKKQGKKEKNSNLKAAFNYIKF